MFIGCRMIMFVRRLPELPLWRGVEIEVFIIASMSARSFDAAYSNKCNK